MTPASSVRTCATDGERQVERVSGRVQRMESGRLRECQVACDGSIAAIRVPVQEQCVRERQVERAFARVLSAAAHGWRRHHGGDVEGCGGMWRDVEGCGGMWRDAEGMLTEGVAFRKAGTSTESAPTSAAVVWFSGWSRVAAARARDAIDRSTLSAEPNATTSSGKPPARRSACWLGVWLAVRAARAWAA
jgi:hypothetical protein